MTSPVFPLLKERGARCEPSASLFDFVNSKSPLNIDFTSPDTVCVGGNVNITNLSQGATTYYWNFCSGSANNNPTGVNIGNPGGLLNIPTYITLVKEGNDCYSFISCQGVGVVRYFHGTSFANNPISWTNLGQFGLINFNEEGIQVKYDNGNWYGFVNSYTTIIRLDFGNSLANTPTAIDLGPFPSFNMPHGLVITQEGSTWLGFVTCSIGVSLSRLNFGNSLANTPVVTNFGDLGGVLIQPFSICLVQENSLWYAMIMASGTTLARISFGTSLLNVPTGINLGNPGGFNAALGLTFLRDCESTTGYWTNYLPNGQLGKLTFPGGITGPVTGTILGNIGGLARPSLFSEIFRQEDNLYAYICNRDNGTLTRLTFPPCTNASVPSSTLFTPPPFSYDQAGTYNIHLIVDEGLPTMLSLCKPVVVMNPPVVNLGNDRAICPGNAVTLDAGPLYDSYLWSNGATTRTITVSTAGTFSVTASRWGCTAGDAVNVTLLPVPVVELGQDITICAGQTHTFDAGACNGCFYQWANLTTGQPNIGTGQTYTASTAAEYMVTVSGTGNCSASDMVQLFINQTVSVNIIISASANNICAGTSVTFTATPGAVPDPAYQWIVNGGIVNGATNSTFSYTPANGNTVSCTLTSNALCAIGSPATSNTVTMTVNPVLPVSITINPSSNNICAGTSVIFTATPSAVPDPVFQWIVNAGIVAGATNSTYSFTPENDNTISCVLTSNALCASGSPATSNMVTMTVNPVLPVSITINPSANNICAGTSVMFTATPGPVPDPAYQWIVNAGIVAGATNSTYSFTPANGNAVSCILTSNTLCASGSPATSNMVTMTVNPMLPVGISISASANPVCAGTSVTFTATTSNGGVAPSYQWRVNLGDVGTDDAQFSYIPTSGDQVSCILTSGMACVTGNPATSAAVLMLTNPLPVVTFSSCFDNITTTNAKPFVLKGGLPLPGTYSGTGVDPMTSLFNPAIAGEGSHEITFSYTNNFACTSTATSFIYNYLPAPVFCPNPLIDIRDQNKPYPTIQIGSQCWMAANLDYGEPVTSSVVQSDNCVFEKHCYNDNPENCNGFGGLYQWDELMKFDRSTAGQGLCPPGWHVPTEIDWNTLFNFYNGNSLAGKPLQNPYTSGFTALTGGTLYQNSAWSFIDFATLFWSSTASGLTRSLAFGMNTINFSVSLYPASRSNSFSVRCLKD